jgi:hypothetical protein
VLGEGFFDDGAERLLLSGSEGGDLETPGPDGLRRRRVELDRHSIKAPNRPEAAAGE